MPPSTPMRTKFPSPFASPEKQNASPRHKISHEHRSHHSPSSPASMKDLKFSSVGHMRTLSKLASDSDTIAGLFIPGVTTDAEDVAGMTGRIRLARQESQSYISRNWMDNQRQNLQAYEYLCHVGEAKEWIESCICEEIPEIVNLEESLRNGIVLARLARTFCPGIVTRIFESTKLQFKHIDNINVFFNFLAQVGLPEIFRFETTDLYNKKNIPKVIYCIHALSFLLARQGFCDYIGNLVGKLEFTEDEINNTQRGLDASGVKMPDFGGLSSAFAEPVVEEPKYVEPEPEPEPEEERIVRVLYENESTIADLQSRARAFLNRRAVTEREQAIVTATKAVIPLQSCIRGYVSRKAQMIQRTEIEKEVEWATKLQSAARCFLTRSKNESRSQQFSTVVPQVVEMQSIIRGRLARAVHQTQSITILNEAEHVSNFQARCRAFATRQNQGNSEKELSNISHLIFPFQASCRGNLIRKRNANQINNLRSFHKEIIRLQSISRGSLYRDNDHAIREDLHNHTPNFALFQSHARGLLLRSDIREVKKYLLSCGDDTVYLQAHIRGMVNRVRFQDKMQFYLENMEKIVKVQSFIRGKQQGEAYKSLTVGKNPPVGTIKNFVHLLNDSNFDFEEEIEFEKLRKLALLRVRANDQAQQHIDQLDIKIALLVKNKITLDEIVRTHKHFGGQVAHLLSLKDPISDPFDLKALNKASRKRLELYQGLFFVLQTRPEYLARLFSRLRETGMSERETKKIENFVMCLYGFAQKRREEFFLLKLIRRCIIEDIHRNESIQEFIRGSFIWVKLIAQYNRRGVKERKFLRDIVGPIVREILENDMLDLESDPSLIYRTIINNEELSTGQRSYKPINISDEEALKDPETRQAFIYHLKDLRELTEAFITTIQQNIGQLPYGLRYLAAETLKAVKTRFPNEQEDVHLLVVENLVFNRYIKPAIVAPDGFGVLEGAVSQQQRKNLNEVVKTLAQIASGRLFSREDKFLRPLNEYLQTEITRMRNIFVEAARVESAEQYFDIDPYEDHTATQKPILYIKTSEIFSIHALLYQELDFMAPDQNDILREIIRELGPLPSAEDELFSSIINGEISLTLNPSFSPVEDPDAEDKAFLVETKRCVLYIIRIQSGSSLLDILIKPITEEDEIKWQQLLTEERSNGLSRGAYSDKHLPDIFDLSYADIKRSALENILHLESLGKVSRKDNYQDILNAIAVDIRSKHRRRVRRQRELESIRSTLAHLDEKSSFLKEQLDSYNDYIEKSMETLQSRKGKKRVFIPFTKQYFHQRDLLKSGKMPQFGSFKYSATNLYEKGVLVDIEGYSERYFDKIHLTISSDSVGVFFIEGSIGSVSLPGGSVEMRLDDLLQAQFNKQQIIKVFDGKVRLNVNLMLHLIFRKFYV
ncbi:Ras GTPase-activating-like protein rng2 [Neolecta irregularis DAH-3]|uniref:Ras GTPase-activating-like protein rng2 n=1 Tax=Neolecta irregularis (strain DAH-3) TaxID=1198029 RepID=A0A1U7LPN5_NEOID|nr:Ras GTPase-activating-like protein rng2 [Neolecta irregularis DAH-3]|eukprot:OLL24588.1 Ras GTPase-activating-like protein rng2 [Neolecta irregularis DAH-3]